MDEAAISSLKKRCGYNTAQFESPGGLVSKAFTIKKFLDCFLSAHAAEINSPGEKICIVSHSNTMSALVATGLDPSAQFGYANLVKLKNCQQMPYSIPAIYRII